MLNTLRFIWSHPLNANGRMRALARYGRWQLASRLMGASIALPYIDGTVLLATAGMTGATGNWYCGLHEPRDMGFLLHFLRPHDVLLDIGANIGSYTVLAAGACGARVVAVEPSNETLRNLERNVRINGLEERVTIIRAAMAEADGSRHLTTSLDTMNRMLAGGESTEGAELVPARSVDSLAVDITPTFIKLDVEGAELEVLRGAKATLASGLVAGLLVEVNGSGARYGVSNEDVHQRIVAAGFSAALYDPLTRNLTPLPAGKWNESAGNTLYLRDLEAACRRVAEGLSHILVNGSI